MEGSHSEPDQKIAFIGCGNMGSAVMEALLKSGLVQHKNISVTVRTPESARNLEKQFQIPSFTSMEDMLIKTKPRTLFICVKPLIYPTILSSLRDIHFRGSIPHIDIRLIVSIVGGVPFSELSNFKAIFPAAHIFRVMPNLPCRIQQGCTTICPLPGTPDHIVERVVDLCQSMGKCFVLEEKLMDCSTALIGSGPAFVM
eukprot:Sdes_comp18493_c0_seq2m8499